MGRVGQYCYLELRSRSAVALRLQGIADREQQEEQHGADSLPVLQFCLHSQLCQLLQSVRRRANAMNGCEIAACGCLHAVYAAPALDYN